jgi:hypothetical protein
MVCPPPDTVELEKLFRHEVFKMLKAEGKINDVVIENMMNWPPAPLPARRAYRPEGRAYASESATADSTCNVVKPFGRTMKRGWPPARRAYASERKSSEWNLSAAGGSFEPPFPKSA